MDIGIELLQKVTESFQKAYNEDVSIKVLEKRLKANKAHYEDAARYSERVGELLAEAYRKVVTSEALPGGVMTWEIAQEVIQKPLIENYRRAATASVDYITAENKRRGIGLKAQRPRPDFDRLDGMKRKLVDAEKFDDVAFMLDRPVVNFTRAVLDDAVAVNADFQAKAGLDVKIVRTTTGRETCDWCKRLAGTYDYEDVRHGHDVWKRHLDCDCKIEHVSAKGREVVQNYKRSNREQIKARKQLEAPNDRAPEKIEARKQVVGLVAKGAINGAWNDKNDPLFDKREEIAKDLYKQIRSHNKDAEIRAVAKHSGMTEMQVEQIYNHVFIEVHNLGNRFDRFGPDYYMAHSWNRLRHNDHIQAHDLIMLKHELLESEIMRKNSDITYLEAHKEAEKMYNYTEALEKYRENHDV